MLALGEVGACRVRSLQSLVLALSSLCAHTSPSNDSLALLDLRGLPVRIFPFGGCPS